MGKKIWKGRERKKCQLWVTAVLHFSLSKDNVKDLFLVFWRVLTSSLNHHYYLIFSCNGWLKKTKINTLHPTSSWISQPKVGS